MLSHLHTSPPTAHGFTLIEILITTGLATALIIAATTMLNRSMTTVEDNLQQDLDAKFTGAFATNFKRLSSRARMAAYFWHQPVNLSHSCLDDTQGGGCGFILKANPNYDPSKPHSQKTCLDNISSDSSFMLNHSQIQFFANKQTSLSQAKITLSNSDLDPQPQISHYAQLPTQEINQAPQNLYVAWRITPNQPLIMITRPYHKHAFLTLPHKFRSTAIHHALKQIDSSQQKTPLILEGSPRATRLLATPTDRDKLIGTVGVAYSINQPSIFSLFIINNILPLNQESQKSFSDAWDAMINKNALEGFERELKDTINSIESNLTNYVAASSAASSPNLYLFELTALNQPTIKTFIGSSTAQIYDLPSRNYKKFHLANIKLKHNTNIELATSLPNERFPWYRNIHRLDAVLQAKNNEDRLVFQPLALIKLVVRERKFLAPGIVSGDDDNNNHCDTCVIKSLQRHAFKQPQTGDEPLSTTSRPLLSGIKPKIKKAQGKRTTAHNKEVIIARKLTSSSLVTIIGAPEDLRCPPDPD